MRGIFLDDERYPKDVTWIKYPENVEWVIARTQDYFMSLLEDEEFDIITFDHDIECYDEEYQLLIKVATSRINKAR